MAVQTYPCPACGSPEFSEPPGSYGICSRCDWEDDAVQLANPTSGGGANGESLAEAQQRVLAQGIVAEPRDPAWRPLTEEELQFHGAERDLAGSPWLNKASEHYYWEGSVEPVVTVTDFYDGPRGGVAMFLGRPHYYQSRFNDDDGYEDVFDLWPIDDETFDLAREDWAIWLRWEAAFKAGETTIETHPALPEDRERHEALKRLLEGRLPPATPRPLHRTAMFLGELVRWWPCDGDAE